MRLSDMKTSDEQLAEELRDDPDLRLEWERTELSRAVALSLIRFRAERSLSQCELASVLNMTQPQVACLEDGDVNHSAETLARVAARIDIDPLIID